MTAGLLTAYSMSGTVSWIDVWHCRPISSSWFSTILTISFSSVVPRCRSLPRCSSGEQHVHVFVLVIISTVLWWSDVLFEQGSGSLHYRLHAFVMHLHRIITKNLHLACRKRNLLLNIFIAYIRAAWPPPALQCFLWTRVFNVSSFRETLKWVKLITKHNRYCRLDV